MTTQTVSVTRLLEEFVAPLQRSVRTSGGWRASCPVEGHAHGDRSPSLKVWPGDHRIMAFCYSGHGHDWKDVYAALGYDEERFKYDLDHSTRQVLSTYVYQDEEGNPLFRVVRFVPKSFAQQKLIEGKDGSKESHWNKTLGDARRVPYHLHQLVDSIDRNGSRVPIWLVEGEKSVELLEREGQVATTTPMGAANWKREYAHHFTGAAVRIIPDNDAPGREYASKAARDLVEVASSVKIVNLPGLIEGQDVDDFLLYHSIEELQRVSQESPLFDADEEGIRVVDSPEGKSFVWPAGNIEIEISRMIYENGNIHAEVSVSVGSKLLVVARRINLQSASAGQALIQAVSRRQDDISWIDYVEEAINRSIVHFRQAGRSAKVTMERAEKPRMLVSDVFPDMNRPTLIFGDSETSKSVLATTILCSVAAGLPLLGDAQPARQGPVLYLDWEDDEELFRYRCQLLAWGNGLDLDQIEVRYYHPPGPLHLYVDSLAREIEKEGIVAVAIDSRGAAQDGPLSYEAETNRFFDAIQILQRPALVVDHLPKSELAEGAAGLHSFGSVFTRGRVVCSWRVRKSDDFGDSNVVEWTCAKWNHGKRLPERSYEILWADGLRVKRKDVSEDQHKNEVYEYLSKEGRVASEIIAVDVGLTRGEVRAILADHADLFRQTEHGGWEVIPPVEWEDVEKVY